MSDPQKPAAPPTPPRGTKALALLQDFLERIILYSRYILIVFYVGLAVALAVYAFTFVKEIIHVAALAVTADGDRMVLPILQLIDGALVSGLIVMVMLSSYENFVGRFGDEALEDSPVWLRRLDPGSLKVKVVTALITISAVKLLQIFLGDEADPQIFWKVIIHLTFLLSALMLAYLDRLSTHVGEATAEKESRHKPGPH